MAQTVTKVLTAHLPLMMADKVDLLATRQERSRGWVVKQALSVLIDKKEERNRLTRESMAAVKAGHVIDHQTVHAWADSLHTENPLPAPLVPHAQRNR